MLTKIKHAIRSQQEYRKAKKTMTLLILKEYNHLLASQAARNDAEREAAQAVKSIGDAFSSEEQKTFMEAFVKLARNLDHVPLSADNLKNTEEYAC